MSVADLASTVDLDREMRQVLIEMTLLSYGSTQQWNSAGGGGESDGIPGHLLAWSGEKNARPSRRTLFDSWLDTYEKADSDEKRADVVDHARNALDEWRGYGRQAAARGTVMSDGEVLRERILVEGKGWPAQVVADALRCTATFVRKVRLAAEKDEDGHDVQAALDEAEDARSRVLALKGKNLSQRQIALLTGVSGRTVGRILRDLSGR